MKTSERMRKSMDDAMAGLMISWPIDQWADEVAQLEAENVALREAALLLTRNLTDWNARNKLVALLTEEDEP